MRFRQVQEEESERRFCQDKHEWEAISNPLPAFLPGSLRWAAGVPKCRDWDGHAYCVASGSGCAFYSSVPRIERTWRWLIHLLLLFALLAGNDRNGTVFDRSFQKGNSGLHSNRQLSVFPTEGTRCYGEVHFVTTRRVHPTNTV